MSEQPRDPVGSARDEFAGSDVPRSQTATPGEQPGDIIDRYKLLQEVGEGGMGTVWMAEQKEPVKRQVALKIIKLGMDTKEVVVRFEAERQALALMDHPNIARVLDGGATEAGRPFFVMELVRGVPITEFCDEARLGVRERLELFAKVCDAVQHAHHKGVIHRDLKPSNVMVTLHDGTPMPKVIDFGIAKATSAELTQKTMFTEYGSMIGTPEYMAPEQAEMSALDVDTRADIYSLGVLLYELLTGTKPFDITQVLSRGYQELLRTIREDEPAKPSTRISTLGDTANVVARGRQVNVSSLSARLRGDIDWIVMKALEKDRSRRYETANGFAADVHRYLNGDAVHAAPPSRTYRLRKFFARRKRTVLAVAAIAVLFVAGAIGTGVGWWNARVANQQLASANTELEQTNTELQQANRDKLAALGKEKVARQAAELASKTSAEKSRRFAEIIRFHEQQMAEMSPHALGLQLREILERETPAAQRESLRTALAGVNFTDVGIAALEQAVVDPTLQAIETWKVGDASAKARLLNGTSVTLNALRRYERSLAVNQQSLALLQDIDALDSDLAITVRVSLAVLYCVLGRAHEAEPLARAALASAGSETADPRVRGQAHYALGMALSKRMDFDEAEQHLRRSLEILDSEVSEAHDAVKFSRTGLLSTLMQAGKLAAAETFARESLAISRRHYSDGHPRVVYDRMSVAELLRRRGRVAQAVPLMEALVDDVHGAFGRVSQETTDLAIMLALAWFASNRADEAKRMLLREADVAKANGGDPSHHQRLGSALQNIRAQQGEYGAGETASGQSLEASRERGERGLKLINQLVIRGTALQYRGKLNEAESVFVEALEHAEELGKLELAHIVIRTRLGAVWRAQGRFDKAIQTLREASADSRRVLGIEHANTISAMNSLAVALQNSGKLDEALKLLAELLEIYRDTRGDEDRTTMIARVNYATVLQRLERTDEALALLTVARKQFEQALGADHGQTLQVRVHEAGALLGLERFDEARIRLDALLAPLQKSIGGTNPEFVYALRLAAQASIGCGDVATGERRYEQALAIVREHRKRQVFGLLYEMAKQLLSAGKPARAETLLVELIALRRTAWDGDYRFANANVRLAASRGLQGKFAEHAEDLERHLQALQNATPQEHRVASHKKLLGEAHKIALRYYEAWGAASSSTTTEARIVELRELLAK